MKKHLILSLLAAGALSNNVCAMNNNELLKGDDVYGQTFFSVRPEFESAFPEKTVGFRDRAKARCDGHGGAFQFVAFGGKSTKSRDLMKYFAPSPVTELVVDSALTGADEQQNGLTRDINPTYFGIAFEPLTPDARYQSRLTFRPERSVGGLGITYRQYIGRNCDCADRNWWLELSAPILHVRNRMHIEETPPQITGTLAPGSNPNMIVAFTGINPLLGTTNNVRMQYGLINNNDDNNGQLVNDEFSARKAMNATGSDIELKLGYDYYTSDCFHFDGYVGLHIPASIKPNGRYVFQAIPGFNQHFGFMTGMLAGVEIWRDCDRSLNWEVETNHRFWVQNTQVRSFDLKNRPWSRYMFITDFVDPLAGVVVPGINVLTQPLKVHPRYSFDINAGLVYNNDCGFNAEIGYNFWARQGERVKLRDENAFPANRYFVTALANNNDLVPGRTNLASNIANNNSGANTDVIDDPDLGIPNAIRLQDLNLLSAAAPAALTNTVYAALGYAWDNRCYPLFAGIGGSYEFSGKNTALNRWLVWGKFGVSI